VISGSCHCGAVRIGLAAAPATAVQCNCSICRRNGALWAPFAPSTVVIDGHPVSTEAYEWGDRSIRTMRCRHCGCVTHWEPTPGAAAATSGTTLCVNLRNFELETIGPVRLRRFDGAVTWRYLDDAG
jgi:hypothetical protein